ncbi:hypothetical protein K0U27_06480 [archaeon]|nr:hypothetical protein [archaeon]
MTIIGFSGVIFAQLADNDDGNDRHESGIIIADAGSVVYEVPYFITSGTVDEITPLCDSASVIVRFESDRSGSLTLDIPRSLLDSNDDATDVDFFVLLDGEAINFEETGHVHSREIALSFEPGSYDLEIVSGWGIIPFNVESSACNPVHDPPYSYIMSPLTQFESGVPYHETLCKPGLQLTQKYEGSPACVMPDTVFELIKRDWTSNVIAAVPSGDISSNMTDATSSYMDKIIPTIGDFKNELSEPYDIDDVISKFGEPHEDIGSGIHIFVYVLNDSTEVWIGYADYIRYVKHVDSNGNVLEDIFVKKTEPAKTAENNFGITELKIFLEKYPDAEIISDHIQYEIQKKHYMYTDLHTGDSVNLVLTKHIATENTNSILSCHLDQYSNKTYGIMGSGKIIEYLQDHDCLSENNIGNLEPITIRESFLELGFGEEEITVFITDVANRSAVSMNLFTASQEWTTIPISNLVEAHNELPETSSDDSRGPGTFVSDTVKAGTYIKQNGEKEFWYTIHRSEDQIITIELQNHEFDRITFVSENGEKWIEQINKMVVSRK